MRIVRVKVEGFRSYKKEAVIEGLKPVNVLVGRNDVGKTNVVEVFRFLSATAKGNLNEYRPVADVVSRGSNSTSIEVQLEMSDEDRQNIIQAEYGGDSKKRESLLSSQFLRRVTHSVQFSKSGIFDSDVVVVSNVINGEFKIFEGVRQGNMFSLRVSPTTIPPITLSQGVPVSANLPEALTMSTKLNGSVTQLLFNGVNSNAVEFLRRFYANFQWIPPLRQTPGSLRVNEARILQGNGSNLPQVWNTINSDDLDEFVGMRDDIKSIIDIESIQAPVRGQQTIATIREKTGENFDLTNTSSGNQEIVIMVTAFRTFPKGTIVLLEEPEIHLHARAQRELRKLIEKWSSKLQFVITTHSTVFAHPTINTSIYLVTKTGGDSHVRIIEEPEELGQIRLELGVNNSDLYGYDAIVFVEGESEEIAFPLILKSMGIDTRERGIRIENIRGSGKVKKLGQYLEYLKGSNVQPFVIADGDKEVSRSLADWERSLLIPKGNYRIWPKEFEDLFADAVIVSSLRKMGYSQISLGAVEAAKGEGSVVHAVNKVVYQNGLPDLDKPALAETLAKGITMKEIQLPPALDEVLKAVSTLVGG